MNDTNVANGTRLAIDLDNVHWRKGLRSTFNSNCVEIAAVRTSVAGTSVFIRDSKDPDGVIMQFDARHFISFIDHMKTAST